MDEFRFEPGDVMPGENAAKVAASVSRFLMEDVVDSVVFDEAYRVLDGIFGPLNELERREILQRWFDERSLSAVDAAIRATYHMLVFREGATLAAVRDGFVALDRRGPFATVLMSHSYVLPEYRRSGVAALIRAAPVAYARRDCEAAGLSDVPTTLLCEMEPIDPTQRDTVVRLMAYGRAGFRVVAPQLAPYAQPDFRDVAALGIDAVPLPFLMLVRQVGEEHKTTIGWERYVSAIDGLQAIHGPSVHTPQLAEIRALVLKNFEAGGEIPLLALPTDLSEIAAFAPLLRAAVLPSYPPAWRGQRPLGTVNAEIQQLMATWQEVS